MTTIGGTLKTLYHGRLEWLQARGFEITCVCAPSQWDDELRSRGVRLFTVPFVRAIAPTRDLRILFQLRKFLRRERFDLVEVSTPKASLVGSLAAYLAGTPRIVHIIRGLVHEGQRGWRAALLRWSAWLPCRLSHCVIAVSESLRDRVVADRLCSGERVRVLGRGSFRGIDLTRFRPQPTAVREEVRAKHGIASDAFVVGYIGRLHRAKGIAELVNAFRTLCERVPNAVLLMLGRTDEHDLPSQMVVDFVENSPHVRHVGLQLDVVPYYAAMDVFALPSHREGLANVLLEAAAMELPIVSTDATGCRDVVIPNETGLRIPVGDESALQRALESLAGDHDLRARLGRAARDFVAAHFDERRVWQLWLDEYRQLLGTTKAAGAGVAPLAQEPGR